MKRLFLLTIVAVLSLCVAPVSAQDYTPLSLNDLTPLNQAQNRPWVSVHDPSVVHSTGNTYYIIGSHRGWARSNNHMVSWQGVDNNNLFGTVNSSGNVVVTNFANAFSKNQVTKVKALVNGTVQEVDFGTYNAEAWAHADDASYNIAGNLWAPDIIWNPTMGKWCMYMSVNGPNWHSVIVLLTANAITGPYVYQGPVTFSGFINGTNSYINWKKTDLELVIGKQNSLPARYNRGNDWGTYWPNDIDPCVFYDDDDQLWMSYGSWSGGIFMLKLDKETGLRDYTVTYPETKDNGGRPVTDPYFGKRIAGGYYSSGEASYIQKIGNYYYLFMSYGGLESTGGYEIAIFRSEKPDGPYLDAQNLDAFYNGRYWLNYGPNQQTTGGMRPFGAYDKWGFMTVGELAQGHNSAIVDDEGRAFIVYHTRFNDGGEGHQVRVHQLFQNAQGWLCAAPFQFDGEEDTDATLAAGCRYTKEEIVGDYEVLIHRYRLDHANREVVTPIHLTLNDNGRITGDLSGSWSMTDGTAYIKVTAGSVTYNGVVVQQQMDGTSYKAICFTATANNGVSIWGWKMEPQSAIAYTYKNYSVPVSNNATVSKNLSLSGTGYYGARVEWISSEPDVISNTGKYNPTDANVPVELTCRIVCGNYSYDRTFNVTASRAKAVNGDATSGIMAYYNFDEKPTLNLYNEEQVAYYGRVGSSTTAAALEEDADRFGKVAHLTGAAERANSYVRFINPLQGLSDLEGFTISTWVRRDDVDDLTGTLWAFTDKMGNLTTVSERLFMTGNAFVGFESGDNHFEINHPNDVTTNYIANRWSLVTLTVSKEDGLALYVDGSRKQWKTFTSSAGTASTAALAAKMFDYQHVMDFITKAGYLQLGLGSGYGSPEASFDDLLVYNRTLSPSDVNALNTLLNRVNDFSPIGTGIETIVPAVAQPSRGIFDLSGRQIPTGTTLERGIYIINGKKVMVR